MRARVFLWVLAIACASAPSAEARFVQTDPVGYQDDLDLYTYVHDDPANMLDPTGLFAGVDIMNDNTVRIVIPIYFSGPGATPANIEAIKQNIELRWSGPFGKYNVTTTVNVESGPDTSARVPVNEIGLVEGRTGISNDHSAVDRSTSGSGTWTMSDVNRLAVVPEQTIDQIISSPTNVVRHCTHGERGQETCQ